MVVLRKKPTASTPKVSFRDCPAKTFDSGTGKCVGRSVEEHCQIVGEVAKELLSRSPVAKLFPQGAAFAAAAHDIGKVSPTFYNKIMNACHRPLLPNVNHRLERTWNGHAGVSQLTAKAMGAPSFVPEILGQHHGFSPSVGGKRANDDIFGGSVWQDERVKLVAALQDSLNESWPMVESVAQARIVAGLTSVSDWIGSGSHFEDPCVPWVERVPVAVSDAGFVPVSYRKSLSFESVFGFPPRKVQSALIEQISSPGVYVLEAPMGLGKTEAALYSAYRMLESGQAGGIYFALPTQLTSNKIYERFNEFLQGSKEKRLSGILAEDCEHRSLLLHSNAWLLDTDMGEEGRPGGSWFNQNKRGLLAPFAVGTIDQALMASMNVKHGFVRAFALAGKVVILDEIHTYDAYTSTILESLIELLRELQCTVIILSATLNQERRSALLNRNTAARTYPLISSSPSNSDQQITEIGVEVEMNREVQLVLQRDEARCVEQALLRAEQGQQVLWIENTVKDAQQRYLDIAARGTQLGIACGLLHSRFTVADRQSIEENWVNVFGKVGGERRLAQGRILVGTQVLEQSLDIDADFMISRFAPTDMLLQRLGRLWRHENTTRCDQAQPEAWLLAPDLDDAIEFPASHFGASAFVYSPYVLCRSLEVWQSVSKVSLPGDIRRLIEQTYESRDEQGRMARWLYELDHGNRHNNKKGRIALQQLARVGLAEDGNTLPESKAQTRYSETDNYEVLILRNICRDEKRALLTLMDGSELELPLQRHVLGKPEWRKRTAVLMRQIVQVPPGEKPKSLPVDTLKRFGLHHCFYLGNPDWQGKDESVLHVALADDTDRLRGLENTRIHERHTLEYRKDLGYRAIKHQEL